VTLQFRVSAVTSGATGNFGKRMMTVEPVALGG
jgi:hypothetical protein